MAQTFKRRDFIKHSLGAGVALSAIPYTGFAQGTAQAQGTVQAQGTAQGGARGKTLYDKLWESHVVANLGGRTALLHIDRVLHGSGPGMFEQFLKDGTPMVNPEAHLVVPREEFSPDYDDMDRMASELQRLGVKAVHRNDPRRGIFHIVAPELGFILPGLILVCEDSHTCTHGAVGGVGWTTESAATVLRTGMMMRERRRNMRVAMEGRLGPYVTAKDAVTYMIGQLGANAGNMNALEYTGPVVRRMSLEDRTVLCNMAIEMGSSEGMVSPDETTYQYLWGREFSPKGRQWDQALSYWRTLPTDADAVFDADRTIDLTDVEPQVTWGVSPEHVIGVSGRVPEPGKTDGLREAYQRALDYTKLTPGAPIAGTPIDEIFLGTCTENRIEHLRAAARIVDGRKVAANIKHAWVAPGSLAVKRQGEAEGLDRIFKAAGFEWKEVGCSRCQGGNLPVAPGDRCLSSQNRNFIGRQGFGAITHMASTVTVAAGAIAGKIVDPRRLMAGEAV